MNNNVRYCDRFCMTAKQFNEYKLSKQTRILWYIIWMIVVTFFNARLLGYVCLTLWLICSYWHNSRYEIQWIRDGSVRPEDLN